MEKMTVYADYKRVNYECFQDDGLYEYGLEYFGTWIFFGSEIDIKMFIRKQYELLPTLDIATDIFEYLPSWDRADVDIFTIAHDIATDIDCHIEYFENEYFEYMDSGFTAYCDDISNILEKLKAYKANGIF